MARKDAPLATASSILCSALTLFREKGYAATNLREIAAEAGFSFGLINHYFVSKRALGYISLYTLIRLVISHIDFDMVQGSVLLDDMVATRCVNEYLYGGPYRRFYLDSLQEDLFFDYLERVATLTLKEVAQEYRFEVDDDMALLYGRYIPYTVEKTLILKKNEGLFPTIPDADVPYQISAGTYSNFLPVEILHEKDQLSRAYSAQLVPSLPDRPSMDLIRNVLVEQGIITVGK